MALSARGILRRIEPVIYGRRGRPASVAFLVVATLFFLFQALHVRPDAGFDKSIPLEHPYMQVFKQYQNEFGGANTILVALIQKGGAKDPDIYNGNFLGELQAATNEVFFLPGIDRAHVSSLFTPDVRFYEVVEGGFGGGANVVPIDYAPTPEIFARIKDNVAKAGVIGRLVTNDQRGAMIFAELLETNPKTGEKLDYSRAAHEIEDKVRQRFISPKRYEYRLKHAMPPFEAGEAVGETFSDPGWMLRFRTFEASKGGGDTLQTIAFTGGDVSVAEMPNPQYNPDIDIHIIGFAKVVGDVTNATLKVVGFFAVAVLGTMLALWWYLGSFRLALLPMCCSIVAVIWEFGLLHTFGYGMDPFAILVPFLVLAVSTSHGVQYVNTWADEVMHGRPRPHPTTRSAGGPPLSRNRAGEGQESAAEPPMHNLGYDASVESFRRLFIPGFIALSTNVAGFLTIYQVPIGIIREMSVNACFGMAAVIITNKMMMPIWLSYLSLRDVEAFREKRQRRRDAADTLWRLLAHVTDRPVAIVLILTSAVVLGVCWWKQADRIIGDAQIGVPELRADSVYNRDSRAISGNFAIGVDVMRVIAETDANSCIRREVLDQLDHFVWRMQNTPGVSSTASLPQLVRQVYSAFSDSAIKFEVIPANQNTTVLLNSKITTQSGLLNWDCTAMPVYLFTSDHKAGTIAGIVAAVKQFGQDNGREYFERHNEVDAAYCAVKFKARREIGAANEKLQRYVQQLGAQGIAESAQPNDPGYQALQKSVDEAGTRYAGYDKVCPVNFAVALGNLGVMAATNEVVRDKELATVLWVYVVIVIFLLLAYRSAAALFAICIPLFMVSIFANALMAWFGIGLKVATLPVVSLAVGIGVDYGIYFYDVIQHEVYDKGRNLRDAYFETLRQTGKAVIFTGICLAGGVATWLWSDLQFQRDMGVLLMFMFTANMLGAVLLCPALCRLLLNLPESAASK